MVSTMVAVFLAAPEVPVTVTVYVPGTAVLPGVKVNVLLLLVLAGLNVAVTPLGSPDAARFTLLLLRPIGLTTLIALLALLPPTRRVRLLAEDERLKLGTGMVNAMVVVLVRAPEVPVTVTVCVPGTAVLPGASVSALLLLVLAGLNVAVTPLGSPDAARFTLLLKPF
jgi:hypothetical protein